MTDPRKVYIIKSAFRDGIVGVEVVSESTNYVCVKWPTGYDGEAPFHKTDVRNTLEEAQEAVRAMAEKRLKKLKEEQRKLEKIVRDGAMVKEET